MIQRDNNSEQVHTESVEDLELTDKQAEETKAGADEGIEVTRTGRLFFVNSASST